MVTKCKRTHNNIHTCIPIQGHICIAENGDTLYNTLLNWLEELILQQMCLEYWQKIFCIRKLTIITTKTGQTNNN